MSLRQTCEELGLNYGTVKSYKQVHPELTLEQILDYYLNKKDTETLRSKCNRFRLNYATVVDYKINHPELTDEQIIEYYINKKNIERDKIIQVKGNTYKNLTDACKKLGLPYSSVKRYIDKKGMNAVDAITYYIENSEKIKVKTPPKIKGVTYKEVKYKSLHKMCSELNISYTTLNNVKNIGYTYEEAVNIILDGKLGRNYTLIYNNKKYNSLTEFCNELNLDAKKVGYRLRKRLGLNYTSNIISKKEIEIIDSDLK